MAIMLNFPDEILENIRQYIGNCRISCGELIMTLDKKSEKFMKIEHFIEERFNKILSYSPFYEKYEDSLIEKSKIDWEETFSRGGTRGLMCYIGTVPKDTNWCVKSIWYQSNWYQQRYDMYRCMGYKYYAETNTLTFHYKKQTSKSKKDPFKKNMYIEYDIP